MDEDADGALGPAEDPRDLRGRHLVDEPQDQRLATIRRQAVNGKPRVARLVASNGPAGDVASIVETRGVLEGRRRMAALRATLVGDCVSGDLEEPDAEGRGAIPIIRARPLLE